MLVQQLRGAPPSPATMAGQEGDIFRKLIGWSVALLPVFTVLVVLQATALSWMVP